MRAEQPLLHHHADAALALLGGLEDEVGVATPVIDGLFGGAETAKKAST